MPGKTLLPIQGLKNARPVTEDERFRIDSYNSGMPEPPNLPPHPHLTMREQVKQMNAAKAIPPEFAEGLVQAKSRGDRGLRELYEDVIDSFKQGELRNINYFTLGKR